MHTMYTREMVSAGSTMTFSPLLVVLTKSFVRLYCSATNGEMLALNNPVPEMQLHQRLDHHPAPSQIPTESHDKQCNNECPDGTLFVNNTAKSFIPHSVGGNIACLPGDTCIRQTVRHRQSFREHARRTGYNEDNMAD